jgi:hypothetical protein
MRSRRLGVALATALTFVIGISGPVSALIGFDTPIRVSTRAVRAFSGPASLVMAGPNTFGIAYIEPADGPSARVYFKRSVNGGQTWRARTPISGTNAQPLSVSMAASGQFIDIVWSQLNNGNVRVWWACSRDAGVSWVTERVSPLTEDAFNPRVARQPSGFVAVVWVGQHESDQPSVRYRAKDTDGCGGFNRPVSTVHEVSTTQTWPVVAIGAERRSHVVYADGGAIWYQRKSNAGPWGSQRELVSSSQDPTEPTIAAEGATVVMGFTRITGGETWVRIRRSIDNGQNWGAAVSLSSQATLDTSMLTLSVRNGHWRALYARCRTAPCDHHLASVLRRSDNGGVTWSGAQRVSSTAHDRAIPIGADGGAKTVVAWMRQDSGGGILQVWARRQQ